jgi:hypothetical protein
MPESVALSRINWIIHPYCWNMYDHMPEGCKPGGNEPVLWHACRDQELEIHELHMEFVSGMKPDEALIIYPIGESKPMLRLIEHAESTLGARCFVEARRAGGVRFMEGVEDPIRRFLDEEDLPGRREFIHGALTDLGTREAPAGLAEEIEEEIREACGRIGYDWNYQALKVIYYNRMLAYDIEGTFRGPQGRGPGLTYDPATVDCVACGEGFEQCAMTWKAMLPHYMGLGKPIENDFRLSMSGAPFLMRVELRERVHLGGDVRLFLWDGVDGERIALFCRAAARLRDPLLLARVPVEGLSIEIRNVANDLLWPAEDSSESCLKREDGSLPVPVLMGTRRGGDPPDDSYYIIARDISPEDFRSLLAGVEVQ